MSPDADSNEIYRPPIHFHLRILNFSNQHDLRTYDIFLKVVGDCYHYFALSHRAAMEHRRMLTSHTYWIDRSACTNLTDAKDGSSQSN